VKSPESVAGGGDPDVGMTGGQAFHRVCYGVQEPRSILVAHEMKFQSRVLEAWAYSRAVPLDFSRPGKPVENSFIEAVNGRLRDECLDVHQFTSLAEVQTKIEPWRLDDE
jgi:putative transposase